MPASAAQNPPADDQRWQAVDRAMQRHDFRSDALIEALHAAQDAFGYLDAETLAFLGRAHGVAEALAALDTAQSHFARVSFDLITARPNQSLDEWASELSRALSFGTGHLSLYQLTIEPGTRFQTLFSRGELVLPDEDLAADLFALTRQMMDDAGLPAYEISNHARPGEESRHNLTYWRYGDYIGIGPGAHGRRNGVATERHKKPENWIAAVTCDGHAIKTERPLTPETRATEALLMGLRLAEGIDLARIAALSGVAQDQLIDHDAAAQLARLGFVSLEGDHLTVEPKGMVLLDAILPQLVAIA